MRKRSEILEAMKSTPSKVSVYHPHRQQGSGRRGHFLGCLRGCAQPPSAVLRLRYRGQGINVVPMTLALFPHLQRFKTPRSVMALRFVSALSALVNAAGKPGQLKTQVETIGFQHLDIDSWLSSCLSAADAGLMYGQGEST